MGMVRLRKFFTVGLAILMAASALATLQTPSASAQEPTPSVVSTIGAPIKFVETSNYVSLDFTMFRIEFYKGTAGYNTIYAPDNSILVYDERIVLEYLSKAPDTWKQRGTPTGIGWQKIDDYHWKVWRNYDDYNGTTYKVIYDVRSDSNVKITIELTSGQTDNYRIAWYVSGITKTQRAMENTRMVFGDGNTTIGLDWSDVWQGFGDITTSAVEDTARGKKASIYFNIGAVNTGQGIVIDPSLVGTSTTDYAIAISYPFQRKSFYAAGRFWVFYSDGTDMVYRTSTDGSTWTAAATVREGCWEGSEFSVWFDGTYLHYAWAVDSSIYYRRGTPNSDGTITWSAAEQIVETVADEAFYPMVSVDSNGYVWIGYIDYVEANLYPYVIRSGNNDGTWGTTPSGFPYQLSTIISDYWAVSVVPLTSGKVLALYTYDGSTVKARRWDGSAWGSEVATTSAIIYSSCHSAVAQGDDVHLTFLKSTGYDILYVKYTYSTNSFGTETTLVSGATSTSAPVLSIDPSTNDLYVFAATKTTGTPSGWTANHIYYVKYTASSGTWGSWTDWIDESSESLTESDRLTCFYQSYGGYIGLLYMTKTASPYNVKFAYLTTGAPAPQWRPIETWTGTVTTPASWKQVDAWTGTIEAPAQWRTVETWTGTLSAPAEWKAVDSWTGALSSPAAWKGIETWTVTICAPAEWRLVESWLGTIFAPAEWKTVETWTATIHAPAEWRSIETWFATIFAPAEWRAIESWTGAVSSPAQWEVVETWTSTMNAPAIWKAVESWTVTVGAPAEWRAVETWTVTLSSPATWKAIETWTGTLFSPAAWKLAETWTGVLSSPATWNVVDGWIGTLSAPAEWRAVETWQATFATVAEWSIVDSWTGNLSSPAGWKTIEVWTATLSSPASWREVEVWQVTLTAVAEWSTVEAWTATVYSPAMWKAVETWTGTVFSTATWTAIETWTGGFSSPAEWRVVEIWQTTLTATAEWRAVETWIGTLSSPAMWKTVETWTAATYAPAEWRLTETWFGEIFSPAEWRAIETWSSTTNALVTWNVIDSWMGALSAPAEWSAVETWTGIVFSPAAWEIVETWTGTLSSPAVWKVADVWNATLSSPATWKEVEAWQATLIAMAGWKTIEIWSGAIYSLAEWKVAEVWTGDLSSLATWSAIETWIGELSSPAGWKRIETWQATLTTTARWTAVDSWTGTLSSPAVWEAIETWDGALFSPAIWKTVETWTGTISPFWVWKAVETWTSTLSAPAEWKIAETWQVALTTVGWKAVDSWTAILSSPSVWKDIETWSGTISSPAWKTVETWTGALSSLLAWRVVETWTSTVSAPTAPPPPPPAAWQVVETWTGTVASPLARVTTEPAINITSSSATLNARIEYGVFWSVNIRFEFRMRGATEWLSTTWQENYTESTYSYLLTGLTASTTYEFRAHITYDGFDNLGDVLEFTTQPTYIPTPPSAPPPIVYDVKAEVQPKEVPSGGTVLLKINVYRVSGTGIVDIFVSYEVVGPGSRTYAAEGWTEAFVSKTFERSISTAGWPAGDYTASVRVRWLDQEVGTTTTFEVTKPVAIERYLWLLALAVLALLLFVLWRRYS